MSDNLLNKLKKLYDNMEVSTKENLNESQRYFNEYEEHGDDEEFAIIDDEPETKPKVNPQYSHEGLTPIFMFHPETSEPQDVDATKQRLKKTPDAKFIGHEDLFTQSDPSKTVINKESIIFNQEDKNFIIVGVITPDIRPEGSGSEVRNINVHGQHNKILGVRIPKNYIHDDGQEMTLSSRTKSLKPVKPASNSKSYFAYADSRPMNLWDLIHIFQTKTLGRYAEPGDVRRKQPKVTRTNTGEVLPIKPTTIDRKLSGMPDYGTEEYYNFINKQRTEKGLPPIPQHQWKLKK